jgi:hypothetical protein
MVLELPRNQMDYLEQEYLHLEELLRLKQLVDYQMDHQLIPMDLKGRNY